MRRKPYIISRQRYIIKKSLGFNTIHRFVENIFFVWQEKKLSPEARKSVPGTVPPTGEYILQFAGDVLY